MSNSTATPAFKPEIIKLVTVPKLRVITDIPVYVKVTEKITKELTSIINLETGETGRLVAGSIVRKELQTAYPKDDYVNKCFMILKSKHKAAGGGNCFTHVITEIADPTEKAEPKKK